MDLEKIKDTTTWGQASADVNSNFNKIATAIDKVEGSTTKHKGYFKLLSELQEKYPSPAVGETAWVGTEYPGVVYRCLEKGAWVNTGEKAPMPTINLDGYLKEDDFKEELGKYPTKTELDKELNERAVEVVQANGGSDKAVMSQKAVTEEVNKLKTADTNLQSSVNSQKQRIDEVEDVFNKAISTEKEVRESADYTLQTNITNVSDVVENVKTSVSDLSILVDTIDRGVSNMHEVLSSDINSTKENLTTETTERKAADKTLENRIEGTKGNILKTHYNLSIYYPYPQHIFTDITQALGALGGVHIDNYVKTTGFILTYPTADGYQNKQFTGDPDTEWTDVSKWQDVGNNLQLGEIADTAYPGNKGKNNSLKIEGLTKKTYGSHYNLSLYYPYPQHIFTGLSQALEALGGIHMDNYVKTTGFILTYPTADGYQNKQFTGNPDTEWADVSKWQNIGGELPIGNIYNLTEHRPLGNDSYYSFITAFNAVPGEVRAKGRCFTYEVAKGVWETKRFIGEDTALWRDGGRFEDFCTNNGGEGTVKTISINDNEPVEADAEGNVKLTIPVTEVDETLDTASTNPVENRVISAKIGEIEASTLFGSDVEVDEDNNTVTVSLTNKNGAAITEFTIPAGSGGGGEGGAATKIILDSVVDKPAIKEGDSVELTYTYDHQYTAGDEAGTSTGQKADIEIQIKKGAQVVYSQTIADVAKGTYKLDISGYMYVGTMDVYVVAKTTDPTTGNPQRKQAYQSVKVLTLSLTSSYNLATFISGYSAADTAVIPYTINGSGNKVINMYVDGVQHSTTTVSKSGTTNGSFTLPVAGLAFGRHTIQLRAELEASADFTLYSDSIYFDIYKKQENSSYKFIATKMTFKEGVIFDNSEHLTPRLSVVQYDKVEFTFTAYDSDKNPVVMDIFNNGVKSQTVSVPRTNQIYSNRFTEPDEYAMKLVAGDLEYTFFIDVAKSGLEIEEIKDGLVLKLLAAGRSNQEENPAEWNYGDIQTTFNGFDWDASGWADGALKLINGANIEIDFSPFATDATRNGATYEIELECANVIDRNGVIVDCMSDGIGFQMTTQEAMLVSSAGEKVNTLFAPMRLKIAFVIEAKAANRLLHLYVNGIRCGCKQYADNDSFLQENPAKIKVMSDCADVNINGIRVYNKALTDDECLQNYIVDRPDIGDMVLLHDKNDVLNDEGEVEIEKLRAQGKSVMRIVGDVNLVNQTNDKKFEVPADVYFYSAYGKEYDFVALKIGLRIQGTSSTTYPRKNYRVYMSRESKYGSELYVNGALVPDFKYAFKPGVKPMDIFCMKADFAESSSTHNTGTAVLINDVWKKCGFLTPPQQYDDTVRTAVDGIPCDVWYDNDGTNVNVYLGKYNFNNEKSGSADLYGFEKVTGFNDEATLGEGRNKCICLEFLNNSEPLCLFATDSMTNFDDALEFRYPDGVVWADAHTNTQAAIRRLWTWVYSCRNNPAKFVSEAAGYFDINNLCAWYLYTDYFMAVDQRAKNMMLVSWDEKIWYFIPYDNDTILGVRNDGVLKYPYTITEDSFDEEIQSYVFAGHDSTLWKLVRENLKTDLSRVAGVFRANMSNNDALKTYNEFLMGNWSERVYNKDGEYKYITPLTDGVDVGGGTIREYNYLYSLQGSREAHRNFVIQNRFALMDAQYVVGGYRSDGFTAYFGHTFSSDNRDVKITASERYFYGYGYSSGSPVQSGVLAEGEGSIVALTLNTDLIVNDPQVFYGASRMKELDFSDISEKLLQTINLNGCTSLEKLVMKSNREVANTTLNNVLINGCSLLNYLDISGFSSGSFTGIDLSSNTRLARFFAADTSLAGVTFAPGAPLTEAVLPATLTSLELRSLQSIEVSGIKLQNAGSVTRLIIDNCPKMVWQEMFNICTGTKYLRVTNVNIKDDATLLRRLMSVGGVDEYGANVSTCRLVGRCELTTYMDDAEYKEVVAHFPELTILQPEYSMYEFDDNIADPETISNYDNKTGYAFGNTYVPSGHFKRIDNQRHAYMIKYRGSGEFAACQLGDSNYGFYAGSQVQADISGGHGDVVMREPHYWYKGVNDSKNGKRYAFLSTREERPTQAEGIKIVKGDCTVTEGYAVSVSDAYATVTEARVANSEYDMYGLVIPKDKAYKQCRVMGIASGSYGAVITNGETIIARYNAITSKGMFVNSYIFFDLPEEATNVYFTINKETWGIPFDYCAYLTISENLEAIEPDWVEHKETFIGMFLGMVRDDEIRSILPTDNYIPNSMNGIKLTTYNSFAVNRGSGFQLMDYDAYKDIINLAYLRYGTKIVESVVGRGLNTSGNGNNNTTIFLPGFNPFATAVTEFPKYGMQDTVSDDNGASYFKGTTVYPQISICMGYVGLSSASQQTNINDSLNKSSLYFTHVLNLGLRSRKLYSPVYNRTNTAVYNRLAQGGRYLDIYDSYDNNDGSLTTYYGGIHQIVNTNASDCAFAVGLSQRDYSHAAPFRGFAIRYTISTHGITVYNGSANDLNRLMITPTKTTSYTNPTEFENL